MELTEGWLATPADDDLRRFYQDGDFDDAAWLPITVPGHWRSAPAFADADGPLLARCRFDAPRPAPRRRAWLTFDGIFYQGDVWFDGSYLGDTESYFVPHTFEVTDALRTRSGHTLAVEVTCHPERDPTAKRNLTGAFQHGRDLDPPGNPGGLWRPVRVTETGAGPVAPLRVLCRSATPERAIVALRATLDSDDARTARIRTELGGVDHELDQPIAAGTNEVTWTVTVEHPALWWPHALGEAVLHDVRVAVSVDDEVSDERRLRTGLRSVRMRRWVCSVNGERLFLKGANQGPSRMALADAPAEQLRGDVDLAVYAGLDLLRLHTHVARPETYDAADERGLLLWQDMPLHRGYARGVRHQATRQARALVDLLGHHPSIALWCGHDDPVAVAEDPELVDDPKERRRVARRAVRTQQLPTWNRTVLDAAVKRALERADGTRPVVAHSGVPPHAPQLDGTDSHLYLGWYRRDLRDLSGLARALPRLVRFVSELGAQAVPAGDAAVCEPARWPDLEWDRLEAHHGLQRAVLDARVPAAAHATFAGWQEATQRYQAELIRRQIEVLRRLKYRPTGGFAVFSLADGHPAVSFAVLDDERRPKLAYEALRRACRPVVVVADRLPPTPAAGAALALDVHVVSDRRDPIEGVTVSARLGWPGGEHGWRWSGDVPADACVRVGTMQLVVPGVIGWITLDLELRLPGGEVVTNHDEAEVRAAERSRSAGPARG